ncbi:MAG: hypothetical protein ACQER9_04720 [Nanobdellota archaeon]
MTKSNILLIEDNEDYAKAMNEVFTEYNVERAETYLQALEKIKQGDYDFHLIDGFFPYGGTVPLEITNELISSGDAFTGMPYEDYIEISMFGEDKGKLPMGALLSRDLKNKGLDNYLVCSAADNHSYTYRGLQELAQNWNLNLNLSDERGRNVPAKTTREYWVNIKDTLEQKL